MKDCPSCSASNPDDARFCLDCGYSFETDAPPSDDPWTGRVVAGRFKIKRKLGEGGMGEVFEAEQMPMGRSIALKILRQELSGNAEQVERFKREAQAASQLSHPNTIIVHDFGQDDDGTLFIAMEFLDGQPLDDALEDEGTLSAERTARIMMQTCGSLTEAHECGMVHRDLKPENIFLTKRGGSDEFVKVLDFGIAKISQTSQGDKLEPITQAGAIFGTPHYMSPEQIRGEDLDARADVYALGVVLYRMIAGELPFKAGNVVEMLTQHLTAAPEPFTTADGEGGQQVADLEAIALRALSKNPDERQASAAEFIEQILQAVPSAVGASGPYTTASEMPASNTTAQPRTPDQDSASTPDDDPTQVDLPTPSEGQKASGSKMGLIIALLLFLIGGAGAAGYAFMADSSTNGDGGPAGKDLGIVVNQTQVDAQASQTQNAQGDAGTATPRVPDATPTKRPQVDARVATSAPSDAAPTPLANAAKTGEKPGPSTGPGTNTANTAQEKSNPSPVQARPTQNATKGYGRLIVKSRNRGNMVFVDGVFRGRTPLKLLKLREGKHQVELRHRKRNRVRKRKTVNIKQGRRSQVRFAF